MTADFRAGLLGDAKAYGRALSGAADWLRRYFRRRAPVDRVEDLVQETLMAVHAKRATYDPGQAFEPWLAAFARYKWADHLRGLYRRGEAELPESIEAEDDHAGRVDAQLTVETLLGRLPAGQALAVRLVKLEGLSVEEASARSGQGVSLVKVNVHRALKRMLAMLEG